MLWKILIEPVHEKTNNLGFRPGLSQTRLHSHRSRPEACNFGFMKKRDCTIRVVKTKTLIGFAVCGYREADLCLCCHICRLLVFLCGDSIKKCMRGSVPFVFNF